MNLVFFTLIRISEINERNLYADLMRKFCNEGHNVYIVTPVERRLGLNTSLKVSNGVHILSVKTLNLQKTNVVEKGIGTLLLESQYKAAIKKYLGGVKFDLITYSTPPITFTNVVRYLKKQNPQAVTYLQLKDIFPQNAVDIGMMSKTGVKGLFYKFFRNKEKALDKVSDYIGCMSPANVQFLLKHNPEIDASRVEVAPNSLELRDVRLEDGQEKAERYYIRRKYELPTDKPVFIYGGNLGKPQGIDYLVKCLDANKKRTDCYFVVVGTGTEYDKLDSWFKVHGSWSCVRVIPGLPKADYDLLVKHCDVGMIFLDHRFTIPNYPSRLLPYLMAKKPIIACTDPNCDTGSIAEENGYGFWCPSNSVVAFTKAVDRMLSSDIHAMGEKGYQYYLDNYTIEHTYKAIISHLA